MLNRAILRNDRYKWSDFIGYWFEATDAVIANWDHGWATVSTVTNPPSSSYTNTNGVNQSTGSGLCPRNEGHVTERQNDIKLKDWSVVLP